MEQETLRTRRLWARLPKNEKRTEQRREEKTGIHIQVGGSLWEKYSILRGKRRKRERDYPQESRGIHSIGGGIDLPGGGKEKGEDIQRSSLHQLWGGGSSKSHRRRKNGLENEVRSFLRGTKKGGKSLYLKVKRRKCPTNIQGPPCT